MSDDAVRVLIVDDSALMRNIIKRTVEEDPGLEVAGIAMNGRFAVQKIPLLDPDILVLDLEMPEMNGIEFLKERQKQGWDIPVVILSAVATQGARITMEALTLGASDPRHPQRPPPRPDRLHPRGRGRRPPDPSRSGKK